MQAKLFCAGVVLLAVAGVSYKLRTSAEKPLTWHLVAGSSVGKWTLIYGIGDPFNTLDGCLEAWNRHKAETDKANEGVPRSPEYVTTAYCVDTVTAQRINIQ